MASAPTDEYRSPVLVEAVRLARSAGELLHSFYGRVQRTDAERKEGRRRDLVSEADREAERLVVSRIPEEDDVLAEEGSVRSRGARRCWIVDPLDGTVNFLHGIPLWSVSIAVVEDERLVAAVVHAPALQETFTAGEGLGCRRNKHTVAVSRTGELGDALLATGFAYDREEVPDNNLDNWCAMALAAAGLRRMGAASLDLAYTACGRFDGFWELHLAPWDVAAGALLVREAGGMVTDFRDNEDLSSLLHGRNIVATNGALHASVVEHLAPLKGL